MMKKWSLRALAFIVALIIMNLLVAWFIRLTAPKFTDLLAGWFNSSGVENTADLLINFTFITALLLTVVVFCLFKCQKRQSAR
ncbi:hypothetical protein BG55_07340 [Erwinia mallotivora]|uniref:Uncharacterized protein n=1 Tax=Erwinia mallotivora TaxID=69222 RepID=A0A014M2T4_9GAMM|nr:hypothetical protein BG55_07340 [Erwinia mallotivora]